MPAIAVGQSTLNWMHHPHHWQASSHETCWRLQDLHSTPIIVGASLLAKLLGAEGVFQEAGGDVALIMRFRQQEEFPINGIAQLRQVPVAELR